MPRNPQDQTVTGMLLAPHLLRPIARNSALCLLALAGLVAAAPPQVFRPGFSHGELIVAAVVATEPPYSADSTGQTDASAAIERACTDVQRQGGGTVFLPAGRYRLDHSVTVAHTVTLCGEWQPPVPGQPLGGTILLAYADRGNADGPPLLGSAKLGHTGFFSLAIYYPEQDPTTPVPYPFGIAGKTSHVSRITLVNSYQGILMNPFGGSSVSEVYGTVLQRGVVLKSSCELCSCSRLRFSSDYWTRLPEAAMGAPAAASVRSSVARELVAVQIGKVDGLSFYDAEVAEAATPVLVKLEDDENKVMVAPRSQYGFGGGLSQVHGRRVEVEGGWYFGSHFFDLDNYPGLADRRYEFAPLRQPVQTGPEHVRQAADFGVVADGTTDDSGALQRALDCVGAAGGGTVLLPRGRVLLQAPLTVPPGVELRGGYLGVPIRAWYMELSTLVVDCAADTVDPDHAQAAVSLSAGAGLRGVNLCHARNLWEFDAAGQLLVHPYPFAIRGLGPDVYVTDVILPNAWHGIDLGSARCDRAQVVGLWGTTYRDGIQVGGDSVGVRLENVNLDVGPLISDYRLVTQYREVPGPERRKVLEKYVKEHAQSFVFGDCTDLRTFHLAGFAPYRFMEFIDQGHGGCRDAQLWSSIFDVPTVETARFTAGGKIELFGLFATGGRNGTSLWAEFDPGFQGRVEVYGLSLQRRFNNRPFTVGPERLRMHLERSLTSGRPVTVSSRVADCGPEQAVDDDPRTLWRSAPDDSAPALTVELAAPTVITRWRVHNAGTFGDRAANTAAADLEGSADGVTYQPLADFRNNTQDWVDLPLASASPVRFVRLKVPGPAAIAGFDVWGDPAK